MTLTRRIIHEKRRYIYPLAAALVLNAILLVAVVMPLSRKVEGGEASAQRAAAALTAARTDYDAARATVTGKDAADTELKKFYGEVLPVDQSQARRVLYKVQEMARKANVSSAGAARTAIVQRRESALGKMIVTHSLVGPYRSLRQFIYDLETSPEFLILENVTLAQTGQAGAVEMKAEVATYYRAGDDER